MQVLMVTAHPEPRSFCLALAARAAETFGALGHKVTLSDLYAMGFDPIAKAEDFGARRQPEHLVYALEQRHGWETGTLAPDIRAELDKLFAADLLVLAFPLFWFSVPAMLKGWIDRVLISGATYGGRRIYDRGPLKDKRALCLITMGSRAGMFGEGAVHGPFDTMLRHLLQGTLGYTGMRVLAPFCAHHVPYVDAAARTAMLDAVAQAVRDLDGRPTLPLPSLDGYDDQLLPRAP